MKELYEQLMALTENPDTPFYFSDQELVNEHYRIFSYHFTDRDSWLLPGALDARGIMFEVTETGEFIRIASRTMQKFFNKGEVDFITYGNPYYLMNKIDGSLISSYLDGKGCLMLKSKASLHSDYAKLAMEIIDQEAELFEWILKAEEKGYTVNMELVSPDPKYRIVIRYERDALFILNVRHRETGVYMDPAEIPACWFAGSVDISALHELDTIRGIEGYVIIDELGNWWKEKSAWYLERHRAKDFINQTLAFVQLVLKEEADDVFALMEDQPLVMSEMRDIQHKVITVANRYVNTVSKYWQDNKHLSRKDFAIKGQAELDGFEFALAMKYYGRETEPDWNGFFLDKYKKIDWGLTEVAQTEE